MEHLENQALLKIFSTTATTRASLAGHERIDVEHAIDTVDGLLHNVRSMMPYLTQGKSREEAVQEERRQAVGEYHKYLKSTLGEEKYHEYVKEQLGEEGYQKFIRSEQ